MCNNTAENKLGVFRHAVNIGDYEEESSCWGIIRLKVVLNRKGPSLSETDAVEYETDRNSKNVLSSAIDKLNDVLSKPG